MIKNFLKRIFTTADSRFGTSLYLRMIKLKTIGYDSKFLNLIRRNIGPAVIKVKYKLGIKDKHPLKLHLGCGERHLNGYVNIDWRKTKATNLVSDIRRLPYPGNSVDLIETYHVVEHLPRADLPKTLKEWHRVLAFGGKLIIECPDFDKAVKEYLGGNEDRLNSIFGRQRFPGDAHLFGYNFERLKRLLEEVGFKDIKKRKPRDYHAQEESCLRVECLKGDKR